MFDLGKCILVTNNDRAAEKWGENVEQVVMWRLTRRYC